MKYRMRICKTKTDVGYVEFDAENEYEMMEEYMRWKLRLEKENTQAIFDHKIEWRYAQPTKYEIVEVQEREWSYE